MTQSLYKSRFEDDTREPLSWARVSGIAFALAVHAGLVMMLLAPVNPAGSDKEQDNTTNVTFIEPPPPPPPPPPPKPELIKTVTQQIITPPRPTPVPPPPEPPVITDTPNVMSTPAPPPAPPAPPAPAPTFEASQDTTYNSKIIPPYPREALADSAEGTVWLLVRVDENGAVIDISVDKSSHNRYLDRSALETVKKYRFNPAMRDGKRVGSLVRVPVRFTLPN
jgi:protein TonB